MDNWTIQDITIHGLHVQSMCNSAPLITHGNLWYLCPGGTIGIDKETSVIWVLQ